MWKQKKEMPPPLALCDYPVFDPNLDQITYSHIDAHARQVADIKFDSFHHLLYALIFHRNITDDFERVRYLFYLLIIIIIFRNIVYKAFEG